MHLPNELYTLDVLSSEKTKSPARARRLLEKPLFFVEPYSVNRQACLAGDFSNMQRLSRSSHAHLFATPEYTLEWTPESSNNRMEIFQSKGRIARGSARSREGGATFFYPLSQRHVEVVPHEQ